MATKSQRQERNGAKAFGGTVNSGSGNGIWRKNDVRTPTESIEFKYTDAKSYSLKLADLLKGERHALLDGRRFIFGIGFGTRERFVVLREEDYLELRGPLS